MNFNKVVKYEGYGARRFCKDVFIEAFNKGPKPIPDDKTIQDEGPNNISDDKPIPDENPIPEEKPIPDEKGTKTDEIVIIVDQEKNSTTPPKDPDTKDTRDGDTEVSSSGGTDSGFTNGAFKLFLYWSAEGPQYPTKY